LHAAVEPLEQIPLDGAGAGTMVGALTPEEKLVERAREGDLDAFERLVNTYQAQVVTTAHHLLRNETDADDVAQEVWIRVFRALPKFRAECRFSTWLYRITVNQSTTALKRRSRRFGARKQDVEIDALGDDLAIAGTAPGARRILEGKETAAEFHKALAALPRKQHLAVTLVLLQGLSHREAGRVMGVAEKTVSWHLFKAREKLLEELKDVL
jgi:RNA polymerase sigma-70 factor (ECF subfamily)